MHNLRIIKSIILYTIHAYIHFLHADTSCGRLLLDRTVVNEVEPYYVDHEGIQGDATSISVYGPLAWCPTVTRNMFIMVGITLLSFMIIGLY